MNYIYDIVLNFNKDYFEFFQWRKGDKLINVKKIPAFRVSSNDLHIFKYNEVIVDRKFIDKIFDLTLFYSKMGYKYMCLVSDTNETIGLMFDKNGKLIKRSSLVFDEEEEVNCETLREEETEIKFISNVYKKIDCVARVDKERREYLYKFINNLDIEKDSSILKYIYYDYFEEEENVDKIKEKLISELKNDVDNKLYELVKMLKKIRN